MSSAWIRVSFVSLSVCLIACKPRQASPGATLAGSVERMETPPLISYHYGSYEKTVSQTPQGTFDSKTWQMITKSYREMPFRAGFYISQHPAYNERYAASSLGEDPDDAPWLVEVKLHDSCLQTGRYVPRLTVLAQDQNFMAWYEKTWGLSQYPIFKARCAGSDEKKQFMDKVYAPTKNNRQIGKVCQMVLNAYYADKMLPLGGVGVSYDHLWPNEGFWYITDPACIKERRSSPQDVLRIIATVPDFWARAPYSDDVLRTTDTVKRSPKWLMGEASFAVLARALGEIDALDADLAQSLIASAASSDISDWPLSKSVEALVASARRCSEKGEYGQWKTHMRQFIFGERIFDKSELFKKNVDQFVMASQKMCP